MIYGCCFDFKVGCELMEVECDIGCKMLSLIEEIQCIIFVGFWILLVDGIVIVGCEEVGLLFVYIFEVVVVLDGIFMLVMCNWYFE